MHPPRNEPLPEERADVLRVRPQGVMCRATTPITPIRIVGRIQDNPWCERHRSVALVVNNVMVGRGLAHGPNDLNVSFIRPGLTSGLLHNWQRTYETDI